MKRWMTYIGIILLMVSCQRELHFPDTRVEITPPEKLITAIVITDPRGIDYDSLVFRYFTDKIKEVHYDALRDSVTRTYYYDAAGRLASIEDEKAIYYTNNDKARRISFQYDASGKLQQTKTDFTSVAGVTAHILNDNAGINKQMTVYDTAYSSANYDLDWNNRIIYSTINNNNYILYDSCLYLNTTTVGLVKTLVSDYSYGTDSFVTSINRRIYYNHQLSEEGIVSATSDKAAPVYKALRKKLYRNLSNWFETGAVWQNDNYRLFPLPGGPYKSILYKGFSVTPGSSSEFTRNYEYKNIYSGDQLDKSVVTYSLLGQGTSNSVTVLRFYYNQ